MGCLRSWVVILIGVDHRSVLVVGLVKNRLSMFFLSVHHMIPRDKFLGLLETSPSSRCV